MSVLVLTSPIARGFAGGVAKYTMHGALVVGSGVRFWVLHAFLCARGETGPVGRFTVWADFDASDL